jgi:hypothetical protein
MKLPMKTKFLSSFFLNLILPTMGLIFFESSVFALYYFLLFHLSISLIFLLYLFFPFSLNLLKLLFASNYLIFLTFSQITLIKHAKNQSIPHSFNLTRYAQRQTEKKSFNLTSLLILVAISFIPNALLYHHVFYKTYTFYEVKNFDQFPNLFPADVLLIEVQPVQTIPLGSLVVFVCMDLSEKLVVGRLISDQQQSLSFPLTIENHTLLAKNPKEATNALSSPITIELPTEQFNRELLKMNFFWETLAGQPDLKYMISMDKYPHYPFHLPKIELAPYEYFILADYRKFDERQGLCFGKVHQKQVLGKVHSIVDQRNPDPKMKSRIGKKF